MTCEELFPRAPLINVAIKGVKKKQTVIPKSLLGGREVGQLSEFISTVNELPLRHVD